MSDFDLTLGADARGLKPGIDGLDKLGDAAERAERRTQQSTDRAGRAFTGFGRGIASAAGSAAGAIAGLVASYASLRTFEALIGNAREFNRALAETSTLIQGTPEQLDRIATATRNLAKAYGQDVTTEVRGVYEALSAGAASVDAAIQIVDVANRAAIGGVTDTATAVDILTSAMNVYSKEGLTAAEASDALFIGVVAGKTTMEELSRSMGQVLPMAQVMGVSLDSATAAVASLTAGGIKTSEAVTGVRASLIAVLNPSKEAQDLAKKLGIDFSEAGLKAKGFGGFMQEVIDKTGGSATAIQTLFGSVEATTTALAFAGTAGEMYVDVMGKMEEKAGATDAAYQKMAGSLDGRLNIATQKLLDMALALGTVLLQAFVPAVEAAVAGLQFLADHADAIITVLGVLALTQVPAVVTAMVAMGAAIAGAIPVMVTMTAVSGALAGVLTLLGGPLGIALAAAGALVLLSTNVAEVKQPFYDAAAGTASLNTALRTFYQTGAPSAGAAAIALANDNKILAAAAFEAANAQLAVAAATMESTVIGSAEYDAMGNVTGFGTAAEENAYQGARIAFEKAQAALQQAEADAKRAAAAVTGSEYAGGIRVATDAVSEFSDTIEVTIPNLDDLGAAGGAAGAQTAAAMSMAEEATKSLTKATNSFVDSVIDGFSEWVSGGMRNIEGLFQSIRDGFKSLVKDIVQTAIANPIRLSFGMQRGDDGSWSVRPDSFLGKITGGLSAFSGGLSSGFMGAANGFLTGGFSGAGSAITSALGGATTGLAGLGAAIGAIAAPVMAAVAIFQMFKTKTELLDSGLKITMDGLDALVTKFSTVRKTSFFGLISNTSTSTTPLEDKAAEAVAAQINTIQTAISDAAGSLGISAAAFDDFAFSLTISTKGMSQDQAMQEISNRLTELGDAYATMVDGLDQFTKPGEGASAALLRLANAAKAVNVAVDLLGGSFRAVDLLTADMASQLVDLFGGVDGFQSAVDTFFGAFFSESERMEAMTRQTADAFAKLGITMPTTREAFRNLVEAQDLTTEAGRKTYAALLAMAGVMDQILPAIATFTAEVAALVDATSGQLGDLISGTTSAMDQAHQAALSWYQVSRDLRDYIADIRGAASEINDAASARAYNEARFQTTLAAAMAGSQDAYRDLTGVADLLLGSTADTARTSAEARVAQARIISDLTRAAGVSDLYGGQQDVIAGLLQSQVDILTDVQEYLAGGGALDPQQIDDLNTQLGSLQGAIAAAQAVDYASIMASLDVALTVIDTVSDPVLQQLLENSVSGITTTVDFIASVEDLTPAERWLALNAESEHLRTVNLVATADMPFEMARLALETSTAAERTINLILGSNTLSREDRLLALATDSEIMRLVNVALAADVSDEAKMLALADSRNLTRMVRAVLRDTNRNALQLGLAESSRLTRTVFAVLGSDLSDPELQLALAKSGKIIRTVIGGVDISDLSKDQLAFLSSYASAIKDGTVTLGGSFVWDPSSGFKAWYETTTREHFADPIEALSGPMGQLRSSLVDLSDAVRDDIAQRAAAAAAAEEAAAKAKALADAQAKLAALGESRSAAVESLKTAVANVNAFDARTSGWIGYGGNASSPSVRSDGTLDYQADGIYGSSNLASWRDNFWNEGGLEDQMIAANNARNRIDQQIAAMRQQILDMGGVPAFAKGGWHRGGFRIVGERGAELEATGPARYFDAKTTRAMIGGDDSAVVAELRELRKELRGFRDQSRQLDTRFGTYLRKVWQIHSDWDLGGIPPTRT